MGGKILRTRTDELIENCASHSRYFSLQIKSQY